ncbi:MAG: hypothetical protein ABFD49_00880 [Armatimonadota bacterium]|nr:hypothetical protein [bacterium]
MQYRSICVFIALCFMPVITAVQAVSEELPASNGTIESSEPSTLKVSLQAEDASVTELLTSLAAQSKTKILVESSVKGNVKLLSLNEALLESALTALCNIAKLQWRKVYISPDSKLLEQPDKLAATIRLMTGLTFPDMVLADSSVKKVSVHFEDKQAVQSAREIAMGKLGMKLVYLITDDSAIAAKEAKAEKSAVDEYTDLAKKQLEKFMAMTPEEREQALMAGINMMDQVDPSYMAAATKALMNVDPDTFMRIQRRSGQMMFDMSTEDRRQLLKLGMRNRSNMYTEEQMQILQEDMAAVMEELQAEEESQ